MLEFDTTKYGPVFEKWISTQRLNPLGPGTCDQPSARDIKNTSLDDFFGHVPDTYNRAGAEACLAGLLLYYNDLEGSHEFSQQLHSSLGSAWHAVMHRREKDYGNSKYWWRQAGTVECLKPLLEDSQELLDQLYGVNTVDIAVHRIVLRQSYDPAAFVDLCQSVNGSGSMAEQFCQHLQLCEWRRLFDFSYAQALQD